MKINLYGNIFGIDGYCNHTRSLFNALYKLNSDIKLEVPLPQDWMQAVNDAELNSITKSARKADVTISISQPQFWRLHMSNCEKFVGFLVWEGSKIPKYWIEYLLDERISQIWVPSQHTKEAIENTWKKYNSTPEHPIWFPKIKIVPHGIDLSIFKPKGEDSLPGKTPDLQSEEGGSSPSPSTFTFLCNKGWRGGMEDRGGVGYVFKAFCEEFGEKEDVQLIFKLNPSYLNPQMLQQKTNELKLSIDKPPIKINIDAIPYNKLPIIYQQSDVYVCAQRADAFNLCGLEAMGCGLPTIQTAFGGQTDYTDEGNGWLIDYKLEKVKDDIQYEETKWAIPDITHLRKLMREAFTNKEITKEKGKQAVKDAQYWSWNNSAQKALNFLKELE